VLNAPKAVDGNMSTRWSSLFSNPQWIYVDLGATYNINRVVLKWEVAYGKSYQIQTSANATTWTNIFSTTTGNGATDDLTVSGTGRYIRMYGTVRGTTYGYSLWELEVYGNASAARSAFQAVSYDVLSLDESATIFPNPAKNGVVEVSILSPSTKNITLTLLSGSSQPVRAFNRTIVKGVNRISLPVGNAADGLYFLMIKRDDEQVVKKVLIKK